MSIYNMAGESISFAYSVDSELNTAYDISGEVVFQKQDMISLKVMTYNVGQWYIGGHDNVPADKDSIYYNLQNGIIQQTDADILLLEEYTKQFSKTGRTALSLLEQYYPYIHEQGGDSATSSNGRCIASKYPISNYTVRNFNDGSKLYYDTCTITVNDIPITVLVTHLHWDNLSKRKSEINTIISLASGMDYLIGGGDLNTINCRNTSEEDYTNILLPLLSAGFHIANCGDFGFIGTHGADSSYPNNLSILDNIFTSSNIQITNAYSDNTKLTDDIGDYIDHLPLIAELSISGA